MTRLAWLARTLDVIALVLKVVIAALFGCILVFTIAEILTRLITGGSLIWPSELSRFMFIWIAFLGGAAAFHYRMHFRVTFLWRYLSSGIRKGLEFALDPLVVVMSGILAYASLELVDRTGSQFSPTMHIPMSVVYSVIPVSFALIVVILLGRIILTIANRRFDDPAELDDDVADEL